MKSKILSALLSLAIALGLWLYVITVVDPESEETYHDVPVVFDGLAQLDSRDLMIVSGTNVTVDLRLLGNRTDLNKLDKTNITILADLSRITEPGEYPVKYSISYPSSAGTIEVLSQDPQNIMVKVSRRVSKEVPVKLEHNDSMPENYTADVDNAVLSHKMVTVTGPEEVVSQIEYAVIMVELNSKQDLINQTCRHTLCDKEGKPIEDVSAVTVNVSDIEVTVKVWQIKEVPLEIEVIEGGGLKKDMVELSPEFGSILVSGSPSKLAALTQISIGPIKLGDLAEDTEQLVLDIVVPNGITNSSGWSQVTVKVKMPEMKERVIPVKIQTIGVPAGCWVNYYPNNIANVKVRGIKTLVDALDTNSILAILDLSQESLEINKQYYRRVSITIPDAEGVTLVGECWITFYILAEGTIPEA